MGIDTDSPPADDPAPSGRTDYCFLALFCVLFLGFRTPLLYRQAGGMDEADYAVPGCTILQEGIPRIPYNPSRNTAGYFYRADEALFLLPPLYFYWQAAFYTVLPPGYGTARLASAVAAVLAIVLIYFLGRRLTGDRAVALWGAGLFSISRVCFFPAMSARPDMLCGMIGLAAVAAFLRWRDTARYGWLLATSLLLGLGGLTHPFALVYAIQIGVGVVLCGGPLSRRFRDLGVLVTGAGLVFSLWLILIVPRYEVFRIQFFNNVLARSGPGLLERCLWPWEAIAWQTRLILEHAGPLQVGLMFGGLLAATVFAKREGVGSLFPYRPHRRRISPARSAADTEKDSRPPCAPGMAALLALSWSSVYLLVACQGMHSSKGYWCYPGAWMFLCVGWCVVRIGRKGRQVGQRHRFSPRAWHWAEALGAAGLLLLMLPGSGIRALAAHVVYWERPSYRAGQFTERLLAEVPRDARVVVDTAYALPFYLDGRSVILAGCYDLRAPEDYLPYDYYIAGPESLDKGFPGKLGARRIKRFGDPDDVFACYAELYEPPGTTEPSTGKNR